MNSGYVLSARIAGLEQLHSCHFASIARPSPLPELQWIDHLPPENCWFGEMCPMKNTSGIYLFIYLINASGSRRRVPGWIWERSDCYQWDCAEHWWQGSCCAWLVFLCKHQPQVSIPHGRQALLTHSWVSCLEPHAMTRL